MATQAQVVWDDGFTRYDFGLGHPMNPVRLDLTVRLSRMLGLFEDSGVELLAPELPDDDVLARVHTPEYIAAVRRAGADPAEAESAFGLGTVDDPAFAGMHEVSARIAEGSRVVAEAVWNGRTAHGVNFTGGLHHAMPGNASGFCVYNDVSLAIDELLRQGATRIAYVDVDAHHGDGVERCFWNDPRVLTISMHETGTVLFPGTGFPWDTGGKGAVGSAANIPLPPGVGDAAWLRAFHAIVPALLRIFRPEILLTQHGADSHFTDPLAHLSVSVDGQRQAAETLHDLAHELCGGKWVAFGGGGYEVVGVVPRAWSHVVGLAVHAPVPTTAQVPRAWLEDVQTRFGVEAPPRMGDASVGERLWWKPWSSGCDPDNALDRAVLAAREAIFPFHGLDVWFD